ncbi:MAG TPA: hypothetical protein VEB21_16640, partial [Terriglobales bacterium]|nr:hypothetical protein [Terriglobales bacterium]
MLSVRAFCLLLMLATACRPAVATAQGGDANCDGFVSVADVDMTLRRLFEPNGSSCHQDPNGNGSVDAGDIASSLRAMPHAGPRVTFLGLAGADGTVLPSNVGDSGLIVAQRPVGLGFQLVIEAVPGTSGQRVGSNLLNWRPDSPEQRPDLQIQTTRPLGDGDARVCNGPGIAALSPPDFSLRSQVADALNDFSCGFISSANPATACTLDRFGSHNFVTSNPRTTQFCFLINTDTSFPNGETLLTVQVRDEQGNVGSVAQMLLRIGTTPTPTATRFVSPTRAHTATPTYTRTRPASPTPPPTASLTVTPTRTPSR